jgi:hypothetical protein
MGHWTNGISADHMQRILKTEYGGMNEALYNLSAITGKRQYFRTATRFEQPDFFGPLAGNRDELKGLHTNTNIPKVIGAAIGIDRRCLLPRGVEILLRRSDAGTRLRDGRDEQWHAVTDATCASMERGSAVHGLLRADAILFAAGVVASEKRDEDVLFPAGNGVLESFSFAVQFVLVVHGNKRVGICEICGYDLFAQ